MALRPELYDRLVATFGSVEIVREGEAISGRLVLDPYSRAEDGSQQAMFEVDDWGETYVVRCPMCGDHKPRLHINHMWGYRDPEFPAVSYFGLVKCFNEECMRQPGKKKQLWDVINDRFGYYALNYVKPGKPKEKRAVVVTPPGRLLRLSSLPATHAANVYLRQRGFDPIELERTYRVTWCVDPFEDEFRKAGNRLLIPVYFRGKAVGWQARAIEPWDEPKYYNMRGLPKRDLLYNYDVAVGYPYGIVVEGVTDVWKTGPDAVAVFGKTASPAQLQLLSSAWRNRMVVCLLDGEASAEADKLAYDVSRVVSRVVVVRLPPKVDPGSMDRVELRKLIDSNLPR